MDIATKVCTRCGGSGQYSFCPQYGTTCFKCGGAGVVPATPKGQKPIKPTADLDTCWIGDIIQVQGVLYEVTACRWARSTALNSTNSKVIGRRLVDSQMFRLGRNLFFQSTSSWIVNAATGERTPGWVASDDGAGHYGEDVPADVWETSLNYRQRQQGA